MRCNAIDVTDRFPSLFVLLLLMHSIELRIPDAKRDDDAAASDRNETHRRRESTATNQGHTARNDRAIGGCITEAATVILSMLA
jgi:hypothetical protein